MGVNGVKKTDDLKSLLIDNGFDPEIICDFLEEQIEMSRTADNLSKDVISKNEFYNRELKYSHLEKFLITLK